MVLSCYSVLLHLFSYSLGACGGGGGGGGNKLESIIIYTTINVVHPHSYTTPAWLMHTNTELLPGMAHMHTHTTPAWLMHPHNSCMAHAHPHNSCMAHAHPHNSCMAHAHPHNSCMARAHPHNSCMARAHPHNSCMARAHPHTPTQLLHGSCTPTAWLKHIGYGHPKCIGSDKLFHLLFYSQILTPSPYYSTEGTYYSQRFSYC